LCYNLFLGEWCGVWGGGGEGGYADGKVVVREREFVSEKQHREMGRYKKGDR